MRKILDNGQSRIWKLLTIIQHYLQSDYLRIWLQLAAGHLIISLFVFVDDLTFSKSCLCAIFFYVGIIVRADLHVASYLQAGAKTAGCILAGSIAAGVALSLGIVPSVSDWGRVGFLCLYGTLGMAAMATVRAAGQPGDGVLASVVYLIALTFGQFVRPARATWGHIVVPFFYIGWVACLAQLVSGCLVLPSLARQDLRKTSANIIQELGHSLSAYASRILEDDPDLGNGVEDQTKGPGAPAAIAPAWHKVANASDENSSQPPSSSAAPESSTHQGNVPAQNAHTCLHNMCGQMERDQDAQATEEEYMNYLEEASNPEALKTMSCPVSPCLRQRRPILLNAQQLLAEAKLEPPWVDDCAMKLEKWGMLVNALYRLAARSAALEGLLEGPEQVMNEEELRELLGCDVVPLFKVLFAQMAASCMEMTEALHQSSCGRRAHMRLMLNPSYPVLEYELASALHCVINASWQRMQQDPHFRPSVQVRVLLYMGALCSGILDALTDVESKAVAALACPGKGMCYSGGFGRCFQRSKALHRHNAALRHAGVHKRKVQRSLEDTLNRTSVRSGGEGSDDLEADWAGNLYSDTQHRPLQQRHSTFLADQSLDPPADSHNAPQQPPHVLVTTPNAQPPELLAAFSALPASAAPQTHGGNLPEKGRRVNGHRVQQVQAGGVKRLDDISSRGGEAEASNGVALAASQGDMGLVRVAHLGEDAFLNDHPLLVRVTPSVFAVPVSSGRTGQQLRHRRLQLSEDQRQGRQHEGMAEAPIGWVHDGAIAGALEMILSHEQDRCCCAVLLDGGIGVVPSAAFLQNWSRHTTLHLNRLQAPPDESGNESGDDTSSESSAGSCAEAGGSAVDGSSAADGDAAEKGLSRTGNGQEHSRQEDGAGSKANDRSYKNRAFSRTTRRKRLRKGPIMRRLREDWGWLWPLLLHFCGYPVGEALVTAYGWALPRYFGSHKSWQLLIDLRQHRRLQFFLKYFIANASVLCAIFALSQLSTGFRKWIPYYCLLTIAVVLSEKVDTTVFKGVLRIIGSAIGGTFGYLVMLRPGLATEPVALAAIGCAATFLAGPTTLTRYKYAAYLSLIAFNSLIFCQYSDLPGHHGSVRAFYARIANIVVGVLIVLVIDLTCPWYTSVAALEKLGHAYREATQLIEDYYVAFHQETQLAAQGHPSCPELQGVAVLEKNRLIDRVQQPLSEVQVSVQKESVICKRGLLIIPDIVHQLLYAMQVLQDRLEAVELMLMQRPIVSGRFTGYAHRHFVQPLNAAFRQVCARAKKVGELVEAVLSESTHPGHLDELRQAVTSLQRARLHMRQQINNVQQDVVQLSEEDTEWTPDDALRFQSFWFALSRALDKCVLVARMVLEDEWIAAHARAGRWRHRQVWLGKTLSKRQERRLRNQAAKDMRERDLELART